MFDQYSKQIYLEKMAELNVLTFPRYMSMNVGGEGRLYFMTF